MENGEIHFDVVADLNDVFVPLALFVQVLDLAILTLPHQLTVRVLRLTDARRTSPHRVLRGLALLTALALALCLLSRLCLLS